MATPPSKPTASSGGRKGRGGRGGRGGGRGGGGKKGASSKKQSASKQDPKQQQPPKDAPPKTVSADELAREEERKRLEEVAKEKKRQEEEAQRLMEEKKNAIRGATKILKDVISNAEEKAALRDTFRISENLKSKRAEFAQQKKTLKADLKKCTAFVKKVKAGSLYTTKPKDVKNDVASLNLSRYVEEIISALIESKPKVADLPNVTALCQAMHERYPEFLPMLLPNLWSTVLQSPASQSSKSKKGPSEAAEQSKLRRFYVRLLTDFVECGILSTADKLLKCLSEWTGAASNYAVQDATAIVAFGKQATFEILGQTPSSVRKAIELISDENARESNTTETSLRELLDDAISTVKQVQPVLSSSRAVPQETAATLLQHCQGAYKTMSTSLVQTHNKLQKLEKRCEQDRLLSGQLPAAREKGLVDARKLCDSLQKSVEALSDSLDQPVPVLLVEDDDNDAARGSGVEVWTKEAGGQENLGPFDDEETRAFYCDVPDFLTTIPPGLLGISEEEIDRRKQANLARYGSDDAPNTQDSNEETVDIKSEAQFEAVERGEIAEEDDDEAKADEADTENKDAPHYKLSLLLEQELPECNRREQVDELSEKFCSNHGSSKNSRKRLIRTLFLVPRTRVDLLPFYARMTTTLDRVWNDMGPSLVNELEQQFHGQAKFKKNQNLEARMRTARYLGELTKFKVAPPIVSLRCFRRCVEDFTGNNVDIACCMLESCGRYLYRMQHTNPRLVSLMETMTRLSKAKNHDERLQSLLKAAFFSVKPPPSGPRKKAKQYPPLEAYLRHLLLVKLEPTDAVVSSVTKQLVRLPWNDPSCNCGALLCRLMLKACRKGRYKSIEAVAAVAARLRTQRSAGETTIRLIDSVLDELSWALENPSFRDQQRTLTYAKLLGELYRTNQAAGHIIIEQLYDFINTGHDIPAALREASKKYEAEDSTVEDSETPVYNSAGGATSTIQEDEEVEESELDTKLEQDEPPKPVAVSSFSKYDPRVPNPKDPPTSSYRITLVCTLLDICAKSLISRNNLPRLRGFFCAFQRYLFTKAALPTDVEFSILDTFDKVDALWLRVSKNLGRGGSQNNTDSEQNAGFPRYSTWVEAHNATIEVEKTEALLELQKRARLEALANDTKSLHDLNELEGEEDEEDEDDFSVKSKDSMMEIGAEDDEDLARSWGSDDDEDEEESDESDGETEEDDEEEEEEFDEEAYMRQMEEEAFERELRRVTMDALEKGKSTSRKLVGDSMISGSQAFKRKPGEPAAKPDGVPNKGFTLAGEAGISFQVLRRGNKGKVESKELLVPVETNLAKVASRQDDAAARERDVIKQRVLFYEEKSADSELTGGNVYLEQEKLQRNRNKTLSMADIDKNFGTTGGSLLPQQLDKKPSAAQVQHVHGGSKTSAVGGRGRAPGRSAGRGGGRSSTSGRGLFF